MPKLYAKALTLTDEFFMYTQEGGLPSAPIASGSEGVPREGIECATASFAAKTEGVGRRPIRKHYKVRLSIAILLDSMGEALYPAVCNEANEGEGGV